MGHQVTAGQRLAKQPDAEKPDGRRPVLVCLACQSHNGIATPCGVTDDGRHQLATAPFAPGDQVRVVRDLGERKRGGRYVTHVRAGACGTVRRLLRPSGGGWALTVQVRSNQYWFTAEDLELVAEAPLTA